MITKSKCGHFFKKFFIALSLYVPAFFFDHFSTLTYIPLVLISFLGPNEESTAVVVLTNLGPDEGQGGFGTKLGGVQNVSISLNDLGIGAECKNGGKIWSVR